MDRRRRILPAILAAALAALVFAGPARALAPSDAWDAPSAVSAGLGSGPNDLKWAQDGCVAGTLCTVNQTWGNGVRIYRGSFSAGTVQAGRYPTAFVGGSTPPSAELKYRAALYVPKDWPNVPGTRTPYGLVVYSQKADDNVDKVVPQPSASLPPARAPSIPETVQQLGMPVLVFSDRSGQEAWRALRYGSADEAVLGSLLNLQDANACAVADLRKGNLLWAWTEATLRATTLLQRLTAHPFLGAPARPVESVGAAGYSKYGYAPWMAAVLDDRVEAAAPGLMQLEELDEALAAFGTDWPVGNAAGVPSRCDWWNLGAKDPTNFQLPVAAAFKPYIAALAGFPSWFARAAAGQEVLNAFAPARNRDRIKAGFLLPWGDTAGSIAFSPSLFGFSSAQMHDSRYPLGAETDFLGELMSAEGQPDRPLLRYDRMAAVTKADGTLDPNLFDADEYLQYWGQRIVALLGQALAGRWATGRWDWALWEWSKVWGIWPETRTVGVQKQFRVHVWTSPTTERRRLWYAGSEDRDWRDETWRFSDSFTKGAETYEWVSAWIDQPAGAAGVSFFVEASDAIPFGAYALGRADGGVMWVPDDYVSPPPLVPIRCGDPAYDAVPGNALYRWTAPSGCPAP